MLQSYDYNLQKHCYKTLFQNIGTVTYLYLFNSNHFKLHFDRVFRIRFQIFAFLTTRLACLSQRVCTHSQKMYFYERRKLRSGYFSEQRVYVENGLIGIRDVSPMFCADSSHGKSFQHVPVQKAPIRVKPAFHGACFWSGFSADFFCAECAAQAPILQKIASHYEHRSCFHMRGLPRRKMTARTKIATRSDFCPLAGA